MIERENLVAEFVEHARSCIGARYTHQGRDPRFGLDCAGLAVWSARQCGLEVADRLDYTRQPEAHVFLGALSQHCDRVALNALQTGDLLIFQYADNPQHLGILTSVDPLTICHAAMPARRVIEHGLADDMRSRLRMAFRFKGF
jgi:hypothetical protein